MSKNGKGDAWRRGLNIEKYRDNFDKIFGQPKNKKEKKDQKQEKQKDKDNVN